MISDWSLYIEILLHFLFELHCHRIFFYIRDPFDIVHVYIVTFKSKSSCYHSGDRAPPPPSFPPYWNKFFQLINENIHSIFHVLYVGCVACEFLFTMVIINIA